MNYPNKTYVLDTIRDSGFGNKRKQVIIVAAQDAETAAQHLKDKLNFDGVANDLIWLMNTNHPTLYDQTEINKQYSNILRMNVLNVQAKIMYNTSTNIPN